LTKGSYKVLVEWEYVCLLPSTSIKKGGK
jgi:hypothetical protein